MFFDSGRLWHSKTNENKENDTWRNTGWEGEGRGGGGVEWSGVVCVRGREGGGVVVVVRT